MKFLKKVMGQLLAQYPQLLHVNIVLPGKRPVVFIKKILKEEQYSGFLPQFFTIEDLMKQLAGKNELKGIGMWLFAHHVYRELYPDEDLNSFLKWFPTLLKDWDDMMKFNPNDQAVLGYMLDEERIKNWAENLNDLSDTPRNKYLDFWQKMNHFLPILKQKMQSNHWATPGMIYAEARNKIDDFAKNTQQKWIFIGFNALSPVEEHLVKSLLQWDHGQCFFQADEYYLKDERQEAGKFLRKHLDWKEFNESRPFNWVENDFVQNKNIQVYEVSGNVTQTKILTDIFKDIPKQEISDTAVILLDENLLPATLDTLSMQEAINITMGFPLKNLSFSNAVKQIFYLQKQLAKKDASYYYLDIINFIDSLPLSLSEAETVQVFKNFLEERNVVYVSKKIVQEYLSSLSCFPVLLKADSSEQLIHLLIGYCVQLKSRELDDVLYENVNHFELAFKQLNNHLELHATSISMEALEVLVQQLVQQESIDFQGEPLQGLQVMGLLETRLLNFKNIILLSVNEGKLPLGNSQNTFVPHDVRVHFGLQTFMENDSIYAYHFYRLLQNSQNVHLLYNALSSGVNTGEKSRFITQMEIESPHKMNHVVIDNSSEPVKDEPLTIHKSDFVLDKLETWKSRVSVSHFNTYNHNPIDFYFNTLMKTKESKEIEEELSSRDYGNLVHSALEYLYQPAIGQLVTPSFLNEAIDRIDEAVNFAINELKHQPEFYDKGMNYLHKTMAEKVIQQILSYDLDLINKGNQLEIIDLEYHFEGIEFWVDENTTVYLNGYIDRIDKVNGTLRLLDYKTAKTKI